MTTGTALTGSGVHGPGSEVTNDQLCGTFNTWVRRENERLRDAIASGEVEPHQESSPAFVEKVSGIRARRLYDASGVLDPSRMCPNIPDRPDDTLSVQAEIGLAAARKALEAAGRHGEEIDLVIVGASSLQRPYPAIAIELQAALGARGIAYDISVGCSSGTFAVQAASDAIRAGSAHCALVCTPELPSAYSNFQDRDSHFILGDAATALLVEPLEKAKEGAFEILVSGARTTYSSAVRNNQGFLNRCDAERMRAADKLFYQNGRQVYRDIVQLVPAFVREQLARVGAEPSDVSRFFFHQANGRMNEAILGRLLQDEARAERAPTVLDRYANTASAGALIAFDHHRREVGEGELAMLCAFGAGYTVGGQVLRRL